MLSWTCSVSSASESRPKALETVWAVSFPVLLQGSGRSLSRPQRMIQMLRGETCLAVTPPYPVAGRPFPPAPPAFPPPPAVPGESSCALGAMVLVWAVRGASGNPGPARGSGKADSIPHQSWEKF